jgi:hypothetical protein
MPATYKPIATTTLGSAAASITFNSIPATYTDLLIIGHTRYTSTNTGQGLGIRFNGDTTNDYSFSILEGNGTAASSYRVTNTSSGAIGAVANGNQTSLSVVTIHVNNYSNSTTDKTYLGRQSGPSFVQQITGLWRDSSAINSITILASGTATNIDTGSTFTIYGIKAA